MVIMPHYYNIKYVQDFPFVFIYHYHTESLYSFAFTCFKTSVSGGVNVTDPLIFHLIL